MGYPGSKGGSGIAEKIISLMPRHEVYVEPFAGHAAVCRLKLAADQTLLIDQNIEVCRHLERWRKEGKILPNAFIDFGDALRLFERFSAHFSPCYYLVRKTLVYFDPPYLRETRDKPKLYDVEFNTPEQHARLLDMALGMTCHVMISGYDSELYRSKLGHWRRLDFQAMTRGGPRTESVWMNFVPGEWPLHDSRFVGTDYRERERIKKKKNRWVAKFLAMSPAERQHIAEALEEVTKELTVSRPST